MILKKGSKGKEVKELQEFLDIGADGDFGSGTEDAVKRWQKAHKLTIDGIVGPSTWNEMGLATTDNSENVYITNNGLTINKHFMPTGEYKEGPTPKEFLFLHHTAGWNNPYNAIDQWARDSRGSVATEFVLGGPSVKGNDDKYDGEMVQAFPDGGYGWHLGKNGSQYMHTHSVGIEVCNFGYVVDGKTYAGTTVDPSQVATLKEPFRGYKTWHKYSDSQIESMRKWMLFIGERDGIDIRAGLPALIKKVGAKAFEFNEDAYYGKVKGVWSHSNVRKDKFDLYPDQRLMDILACL